MYRSPFPLLVSSQVLNYKIISKLGLNCLWRTETQSHSLCTWEGKKFAEDVQEHLLNAQMNNGKKCGTYFLVYSSFNNSVSFLHLKLTEVENLFSGHTQRLGLSGSPSFSRTMFPLAGSSGGHSTC